MRCVDSSEVEARKAIIKSHFSAIRSNPDFMRDAKIDAARHEPDRVKDVFKVRSDRVKDVFKVRLRLHRGLK